MATRKKTTTRKTNGKQATAKKAAAKRSTKKSTANAPADQLVTFAVRIPKAERDAIHAAAGPRGATQFVRRAAAAAAQGSEKAFRQLLKEAKEARAAAS